MLSFIRFHVSTFFFFFKQKTAYEMRISDWSSDVCSSDLVPGIFARHSELVDSTLSVSSEEAIAEMRQLARGHGLLCGPSSGAHLIAARRVREQHPEFDTVVTLFCDEGEKYLQDHFSKPDGDVVRSAFN